MSPKFGLGGKSALQKLQIYVALKAIFETGVFIEQKLVSWKQKNTLETSFITLFGASFFGFSQKICISFRNPVLKVWEKGVQSLRLLLGYLGTI